MALFRWGFESGNNGDTLDLINSGADAVLTTGGTATITTTNVSHGTRAARLVATTTAGYMYFSKSFTGVTALSWSLEFYIEALPSTDAAIIWFGNGTSQQIHVEMTPTGAIRIRDDANAAKWNGTITTSAGTMSVGSKYRMEFYATASATTGSFRCVVYPTGDGTTPVSGMDSGVMTNQNTGTLYNTVRCGIKVTSGSATGILVVDDYAMNDGVAALIGPYTEALATPAVVITASTNPTTVGGTNGSITFTWAPISGATAYDAALENGSVTTGFTADVVNATSPYTFSGLPAGVYTVAVRAKP